MPKVLCKVCKEEFYAKPSHLERGWGSYCSSKCQYETYRKGEWFDCKNCGKKVWRRPSDLKKSATNRFFCSKSCHMTWKNKVLNVGENHPNWTGGKSSGRGIIERSNRTKVCVNCGNADKRVLAVHHKDRNRGNNKLVNLVWLCHNCHHLVHNYDIVS